MSSGVAAGLLLLNIGWATAQCTLENVYYERLLCPCPVLHFAESNKSMFCLHRKSFVVALSSAFLALAFPIHSKRNRSRSQGRPVFRWLLWVKSQASTTSPLSVLALFPSGIWHRLSTSNVVTCCHIITAAALPICVPTCSNSSWHQENRAVVNDVNSEFKSIGPKKQKRRGRYRLTTEPKAATVPCWGLRVAVRQHRSWANDDGACCAILRGIDQTWPVGHWSSTVHPITSPCCQLNSQNLTCWRTCRNAAALFGNSLWDLSWVWISQCLTLLQVLTDIEIREIRETLTFEISTSWWSSAELQSTQHVTHYRSRRHKCLNVLPISAIGFTI